MRRTLMNGTMFFAPLFLTYHSILTTLNNNFSELSRKVGKLVCLPNLLFVIYLALQYLKIREKKKGHRVKVGQVNNCHAACEGHVVK